jgi:hypothetical protein
MEFIDPAKIPPWDLDLKYFYPNGWKHYENHVIAPGPDLLGHLNGSAGDINRFGARYRVANAYKGVELRGYSGTTNQGYVELFRIMLVWSAFELFMDVVIATKQADLTPIFVKHGLADIQAKIRAIDVNDLLFKFIYGRVKKQHKDELDNYFKDDPCNVAYLASAIRHVFAHGDLTPNSGGAEPEVVAEICRLISSSLMKMMNDEFAARVDAFMHDAYDHP